MQLRKLDDYQSWLIEIGDRRVLVDPWLTETFAFPQGRWLFHRGRHQPGHPSVDELPPVHLLLLTAHFSDHLNPETLARLDHDLPVAGSRAAMRRARKLGFTNTTVLRAGDTLQIGAVGSISAVAPGFPYSRNSIGVIFRESATGRSAYLETHVVAERRAPTVDALITTVESVRLMGVQLAMDASRTLGVVRKSSPRYLVPTGDRPGTSGGLLSRILQVRGSVGVFRDALTGSGTATELVQLGPGEQLSLT